MMDQERIGQFIKKIRNDNNLTQREFADKLGVTFQAVSKWENGKSVPDISILKLISEEFDVDIDEIINGEKKINNTKNNISKFYSLFFILIILIVLLSVIYIRNKNNNNFEFKTISSKCSDFKITGSAAYNKEKTAIYISNVEFCGDNDNNKYKSIDCVLYEKNKDTKTKISSCKKKSNISLVDFLKSIRINVDNYNYMCPSLTSNSLTLEINAVDSDNKNITYTIPIKLNDNCK